MKPIDRYRSFDINLDTFFERFMQEGVNSHTQKAKETNMNTDNINDIQVGFDEMGNVETYTKTQECEDILLQACEDYIELGYTKADLIEYINENL